MRQLGPRKAGQPLWWKAAARNKKSVTLDIESPDGRALLLDLVKISDVLVENFRPGVLERHGLGPDVLQGRNPRLVIVRISGFGQVGPGHSRPGFGRIAEAMSGASQLTGDPDGPPGHVGYSLADMLSGLMGAFGALLCLMNRHETGEGDQVDIALYESLFRLIDWQTTVYDQLGVVPTRGGSNFPAVLTGVAAGVAQSSNGVWMSYSAATDSVLQRMVRLAFGEHALADPRFSTADSRAQHVADIQDGVEKWIAARSDAEVERGFAECGGVVGRVYDMAKIWTDPSYRRETISSECTTPSLARSRCTASFRICIPIQVGCPPRGPISANTHRGCSPNSLA